MANAYWIGNNGNAYLKTGTGVQDLGRVSSNSGAGFDAQFGSAQAELISNPSGSGPAVNGTGGSGTTAANSQINTINSLLGLVNTQRDEGLNNLNSSFAEQQRRLQEQKQSTMTGYDDQAIKNTKDRTRGYEQVDDFANNSSNSLARLFQGANAGASSVARLLAPHLVGKAAGSRRTGVTETANENEANIGKARKSAEDEYGYTEQDLGNQRLSQERTFRENIVNKENELLGKRLELEQDAGLATEGTQNDINSRMAQLNELFGNFKPSYNMRATPTQAANLNSYSVDPAQFRLNQNSPAETRYYAPQLKKKQEMA